MTINLFWGDQTRIQEIIISLSKMFEVIEWKIIHRELYYRIELPLLHLLEDISYLKKWKMFDLKDSRPDLSTPLLNNDLFIRKHTFIDSSILPLLESLSRKILQSNKIFNLSREISKIIFPNFGRNQLILLAKKK